MPSWVGDAVMATPALRLLRDRLPGAFIGALVRPGIDEILAGSSFFDELHVERSAGVMGPKHVAAKLRPRRYDAALLLTNSFSTALITRIAGIPRRIGYNRDARGLLLTDRLDAPKREGGRWAVIPAVSYYLHAAAWFLNNNLPRCPANSEAAGVWMELATTPEQREAGAAILTSAGIPEGAPLAIVNPGGNNPAKRWPPDRFAAVGRHLMERHGCNVLVSGSPAEAELCEQITMKILDFGSGILDLQRTSTNAPSSPAEIQNPKSKIQNPPAFRALNLSTAGLRLGSLKAIVERSRIMVTNDTGPRHIAAAFGIPVVSLFGPTDPRWTTIPAPGGEIILVADPTLPPEEVADDHPEGCSIERIETGAVIEAVDVLLSR
jgi:heptosyltransferase II